MIEVKPMDEGYIHSTCLHEGPVDTTTWVPDWDPKRTELPPHPWAAETIVELTRKHGPPFCGGGAWGMEFMREMIHRHGTCAILAWNEAKVVGHLQFYPMALARLIDESWPGEKDVSPILNFPFACEPDQDEGTLWVYCVMTARPYVGSASSSSLPATTADEGPTVVVSDSGRRHRTREEAGARRGLGLRLVQALISWAKQHGWKRIVKVAHCDLDWFYGIQGGGGKAFWLKAGFRVADTLFKRPWEPNAEDQAIMEVQMDEQGITERDVWTWHKMVYDLR